MNYAPGTHLLIDHFGGSHLDDEAALRDVLSDAARAAGAQVLGCESHRFADRAGVTAVVLLAESHISIHTWPEREYAAIDIFMCGAADPHIAEKYLASALSPKRVAVTSVNRGEA